MKNICLMTLILIGFAACKQDSTTSAKNNNGQTTYTTPDEPKIMLDEYFPNWLKNANIYEVNIRQYTKEGTFKAFTEHIPRLKSMGVDILWFMPVYPISSTKKKGSLGSYYAVSDFTKVNPEFGTLQEFKEMVYAIHQAQMKIILDFVPNHTGWDHVWIKDHPDYYTQDSKGNILDPIDPSTGKSWGWTDVADLNFDNQEMRKEMIQDLLYWVKKEKVDGFRMDVAHGVPQDFWAEASSALYAEKKDLFLLAEAEIPDLLNKHYFHVDYGWEFHHILNSIAKGEAGPKQVEEWYNKKNTAYTSGWQMQFTSNHDENSWAGTTEERMGKAHKALAALAFTFDGMPLIYGGQEEPLTKRLEFFEKDDIGFKNYKEQEWYSLLLNVKHINMALWNGKFGAPAQILTADDQVFAFKRERDTFVAYGIFNLSDSNVTYTIPEDIKLFDNVLNRRKINLSKGQELTLEPWSHMVLSNF